VLNLLRDLHSGTGARVRVGSAINDPYTTISEVRQGCVLLLPSSAVPALKGVTLGRYKVTDLDYANDLVLPASQLPELEIMPLRILSGRPNHGPKCVLSKGEDAMF